MNLANKLTIVRIFLVPIFLIFIAVRDIPYGTIVATVVFVLAALTDRLDGYIARSRNQITRFGKFMDPLADKLLVTAALVSLVEYQIIPSWAAMVIIAREFAVTGLRTIAAADGVVIAASKWGKIKTVMQIVAIIFALIQVNISAQQEVVAWLGQNTVINTFFKVMTDVTLYLTVLVTIISGYDYFAKNKGTIKTDN